MVIHYIKDENIFVVINYKLFRKAEKMNCHNKDYFKINGKQKIKMPEKLNKLDSKIIKENLSHHF